MDRLLICGTNWLGDTVMSMPALQMFKHRQPDTHITVLAKPGMVPLWRMHAAVDAVIALQPGHRGTLPTARALRRHGFDRAVIFPNSFRSALLPFLAGIPRRIGVAAHYRRFLLTSALPERRPDDQSHQVGEYVRLLGLDMSGDLPAPCIRPSEEALNAADRLLGNDPSRIRVAVLPGAARGGSKRWPAERFAAVAQELVQSDPVDIVLCGTVAERAECDQIASAVGDAAVNLAGRTTLPVLAAALSRCRVALSNDSGGMHLATALGVPVVAIFGMTDPALTGPLGEKNRVLCGASPEQRTRDVPRESAAATAALMNVTVDRVSEAVRDILESP